MDKKLGARRSRLDELLELPRRRNRDDDPVPKERDTSEKLWHARTSAVQDQVSGACGLGTTACRLSRTLVLLTMARLFCAGCDAPALRCALGIGPLPARRRAARSHQHRRAPPHRGIERANAATPSGVLAMSHRPRPGNGDVLRRRSRHFATATYFTAAAVAVRKQRRPAAHLGAQAPSTTCRCAWRFSISHPLRSRLRS
jgi:hypothetical protein